MYESSAFFSPPLLSWFHDDMMTGQFVQHSNSVDDVNAENIETRTSFLGSYNIVGSYSLEKGSLTLSIKFNRLPKGGKRVAVD